jgi:hypothetical protein
MEEVGERLAKDRPVEARIVVEQLHAEADAGVRPFARGGRCRFGV